MLTRIDLGSGPVSFFNGTPHPINLIAGAEFNSAIRKHVGGREIAVIPTNTMLSARLETFPVADLGSGVTVAKQTAVSCDRLPKEVAHADYIVVSAMYGVAYRQIFSEPGVPLVTIRDLVVESAYNTRPVGCCGFALV